MQEISVHEIRRWFRLQGKNLYLGIRKKLIMKQKCTLLCSVVIHQEVICQSQQVISILQLFSGVKSINSMLQNGISFWAYIAFETVIWKWL